MTYYQKGTNALLADIEVCLVFWANESSGKNRNQSTTVKLISNSKIISIDFYSAIHKRSVSKISLLMTIKFWPKIQFDLIASMRDCRLMK